MMKLARDGKTQLEDDAEDTTVAPVTTETEETTETTETTGSTESTETNDSATTETAEESDETVVTIGDETPPEDEAELAKAPEWVKELRKNHRETQRQLREANEKLAAVSGAELKPAALGEKPTLESCDYDASKFESELTSWHQRKLAADEEARKRQDDEKTAKAAWQAKLDAYGQAKAKLKVKDVDEVEAVVQEVLSTTQQGVILQGAENPALLVYALGKNPKKAKELAAIKDPVKFAFAVAKLETQLKVTTRKAPAPEEKISGSGPISGSVDSQLARLRSDAEKTGDYTKVNEYKRQKKKAA